MYLVTLMTALQKGISTYMSAGNACVPVPLTVPSSAMVTEISAHVLGKMLCSIEICISLITTSYSVLAWKYFL